ncbi:MAG: hypothetical protein ACRCWC_11720 [Plesiomonas shigelloides]
MTDFIGWWDRFGSGIAPCQNEDREEHARSIAQAAWDTATFHMHGNARLIAAAPDLLEALIAIRDGGVQGGEDFHGWHDSYKPAIEKARAAIAKAEGVKND